MPSSAERALRLDGLPAVLVIATAAALLALGSPGAVRAAVVLPYLLVAPGLATVAALGLPRTATGLALGVAVGGCLAELVALLLTYAGLDPLAPGLALLGTWTLVGAMVAGGRS